MVFAVMFCALMLTAEAANGKGYARALKEAQYSRRRRQSTAMPRSGARYRGPAQLPKRQGLVRASWTIPPSGGMKKAQDQLNYQKRQGLVRASWTIPPSGGMKKARRPSKVGSFAQKVESMLKNNKSLKDFANALENSFKKARNWISNAVASRGKVDVRVNRLAYPTGSFASMNVPQQIRDAQVERENSDSETKETDEESPDEAAA
jgi:hypothetical protein